MNYYNYPFNPVFSNTPQQQFNNGGNFYYVNSKQEAENWIVNPDSTVFLLDRANKQFFIKTVEKNGLVKPLEVYTFKQEEVKETVSEYATKEDIENLRRELLNEFTTNSITDKAESEPVIADVVSEGQDKPTAIQ